MEKKSVQESLEKVKATIRKNKVQKINYSLEWNLGGLGLNLMEIREDVKKCIKKSDSGKTYQHLMAGIDNSLERIEDLNTVISELKTLN